jgi:hypothetical protein
MHDGWRCQYLAGGRGSLRLSALSVSQANTFSHEFRRGRTSTAIVGLRDEQSRAPVLNLDRLAGAVRTWRTATPWRRRQRLKPPATCGTAPLQPGRHQSTVARRRRSSGARNDIPAEAGFYTGATSARRRRCPSARRVDPQLGTAGILWRGGWGRYEAQWRRSGERDTDLLYCRVRRRDWIHRRWRRRERRSPSMAPAPDDHSASAGQFCHVRAGRRGHPWPRVPWVPGCLPPGVPGTRTRTPRTPWR